MKLLSLHITNFGKLSNFDYNFNDNLNIINERNGWGKSTLADFIRAMLYSLPQTRSRNVNENHRKKYKPWNGGEFGGTLSFEADGNQYKIERTFGLSESEDTFKLISLKTNKESIDFSSNIGYELFGLDLESFTRTTYVPQLDLKIDLTDNISAKLSDLTKDKDDVNSFNSAIALLDEKRKLYQKTGDRGRISEVKNQLEKINNDKQTLISLTESINDLELKKSQIKESINNLEQKEKEIGNKIDNKIKFEKIKNLKKLKDEVSSLESELNKIKSSLNGAIPTQSELEQTRKQCENKIILNQNIENLKLQIENFESELETYNKFWNNKELSKNDNAEIELAYNDYLNAKNANIDTTDIKTSTYNTTKKKTNIILIALSLIPILLITLLFLTPIKTIIAIISSIAILSIYILAMFFVIIKQKNKEKYKQNINFDTIHKKQTKLESLLNFSYDGELDSLSKYHIYKDNLTKYNAIKEKYNICLDNLQNKNNELIKLNKTIESFLNFYSNNYNYSNPSDLIFELSKATTKFEQTLNQYNLKSKELNELSSKTILENAIDTEDNLDELNNSRIDNNNKLKHAQKELDNINITLERYKIKFDELDELTSCEDKLKEELEEMSHKLSVIETTSKYLKIAKEELDSAFIKPIATNFEKLTQDLKAEDIANFKIDTDLNIKIEHNGQTKELSFFSKGYQDLAYICARISSIESMFKKDKPFIILDDPFVNLDPEKLELCKKLLQTLSHKYQMIYLVCHDSRI